MGRCLVLGLVLVSACNAQLMDPSDTATDGSISHGDASDGAQPDAFMLGPWSAPVPIPIASTLADEDDGTLSSTGLELFFSIVNTADANRKDLYVATRATTSAAFNPPTKLPFSLTGTSEETPRLAPDDKTIYFASDRAGGPGGLDIYQATRQTATGPWSTPVLVAGPNTTLNEKWFMPCGIGNDYLVVAGTDLAAGTVGGVTPTMVAELSSPQAETGTFLTADCLTVYFASARVVPTGIYTAHRASKAAPWQTPTAITDFATLGGAQEDPWIAADGRSFVFVSSASGSKNIYLSTR